jgi:hypothetical protein
MMLFVKVSCVLVAAAAVKHGTSSPYTHLVCLHSHALLLFSTSYPLNTRHPRHRPVVQPTPY